MLWSCIALVLLLLDHLFRKQVKTENVLTTLVPMLPIEESVVPSTQQVLPVYSGQNSRVDHFLTATVPPLRKSPALRPSSGPSTRAHTYSPTPSSSAPGTDEQLSDVVSGNPITLSQKYYAYNFRVDHFLTATVSPLGRSPTSRSSSGSSTRARTCSPTPSSSAPGNEEHFSDAVSGSIINPITHSQKYYDHNVISDYGDIILSTASHSSTAPLSPSISYPYAEELSPTTPPPDASQSPLSLPSSATRWKHPTVPCPNPRAPDLSTCASNIPGLGMRPTCRPRSCETQVQTTGGIGNRLRVLVSYMAVAWRSGCSVTIYWPRDYSSASLFGELFLPIPGVTVLDTRAPDGVNRTYSVHREFRASIHTLIVRYIRPIPELVDRINAFREELGENYAAVHIRRTDLNTNYGDDSRFVSWAKRFGKVYVATDNPVSLAAMRRGLPGRVVAIGNFINLKTFDHTKPKDYFKFYTTDLTKRKTLVTDAVVDMWTASFAAHFMGTSRSSYSGQINGMKKQWEELLTAGC